MTAPLLHPERGRLLAFGLGKLDPDEASQIEGHIAQCDTCCQALLALQDDTFVELIRRSDQGAQRAGADRPLPVDATLCTLETSESAAELPTPLVDHPRYRILRLLGRGGMGDVYQAEHKLMNRLVALKVIKSRLINNPQAVERFRREVQAAARLAHPNIVTAHDAEQAGDVHFLVMEYVAGTNLAQVVEERGPLDVAMARDYVRQAAQGLQCAFEAGMVHRDIKPHNLMVTQSGQVKILDFGLAAFVSDVAAAEVGHDGDGPSVPIHLTSLGSVMGTPDYIAPEQSADAHAADTRADIYALGCTLYFLLAGQPPFPEESVLEKVKAHAEREPRPIRELRQDVPVELAAVVERMMAKAPAERYQTPSDVVKVLEPFAAPSAVGGRRRARLGWLAAVAVAVLALAGTILYVQLGKTTIRFEIEDPSLAVRFGDQRISVDNAGQTIEIKPGDEQRFLVEQNGVEAQANSFTLKKGDKIVLKVSVVNGRVAVVPRGASIALKRETLAGGPESDDKEWRPLFDGRSLAGWRLLPYGDRPGLVPRETKPKWVVEDGWLVGDARTYLVSRDQYDDFELTWVWKSSKEGVVGGVFYRVPNAAAASETGDAVQQLSANFHIGYSGRGIGSSGAVCGILGTTKDAVNAAGRVNTGRIVCRGSRCEHWLNGEKVLEFDVASDTWKEAVSAYRAVMGSMKHPELQPQESFGESSKGHIALHAGGGTVWYRNVKIRRLAKDGDDKRAPMNGSAAIDPASPAEAQKLQQFWAKRLSSDAAIGSSLGMSLRLVPPGQFEMGSSRDEIDLLPLDDWFFSSWQRERMWHEAPKHRVRISRPFWMGAHEVTVGQFRKFVDATGYKTTAENVEGLGGYGFAEGGWRQNPQFHWRNPGFEQTDDHPVGNVSWEDADAFCRWLSRLEQKNYRLPTEAEWEYACRAGTTTWFHTGDRDEGLKTAANIADASLSALVPSVQWARRWNDGFPFTAPVGKFQANAFGLHDMHGNAWEWCQDWYDATFYEKSPNVDPVVAQSEDPNGRYHVFRGGGWDNYPGFIRSADRYSSHAEDFRTEWAGFRVVCEIPHDLAGLAGNEGKATVTPAEDPAAREFFRKFERTMQEQKSISLLYAGELSTTKRGRKERGRYFGMWQTKPNGQTAQANWFTRRDGGRGMVAGAVARSIDTFYDAPPYDFYINPVTRSGGYSDAVHDLLEYRLWQPRRNAAAELGLTENGLKLAQGHAGDYAWAMWPIEKIRFGEGPDDTSPHDPVTRSLAYTLRPTKETVCDVRLWLDEQSLAPKRRTIRFQVESREFLADERYVAFSTDEIPDPFGENNVANELAPVVIESGRVEKKTGDTWQRADWLTRGETYRVGEPTLLFVGRQGNVALAPGSEFRFDDESFRLTAGHATASLLYFARLKCPLRNGEVTIHPTTGTCGRAIYTLSPNRILVEEGSAWEFRAGENSPSLLLREGIEYAVENGKLVAQKQRTLPPILPAQFEELPVLQVDMAGIGGAGPAEKLAEKFLLKGRAIVHEGRAVVASQPGITPRDDAEIVIQPGKIIGRDTSFTASPTTVVRVRYLLNGPQHLDVYLHNKTQNRECRLNLPFAQQKHWTTLTFPVLDVGALFPMDQPAPGQGDEYDTIRFVVWKESELLIDRLEIVEMEP